MSSAWSPHCAPEDGHTDPQVQASSLLTLSQKYSAFSRPAGRRSNTDYKGFGWGKSKLKSRLSESVAILKIVLLALANQT